MSMNLYAYKEDSEGNYRFAFPRGWMEEAIYPEGFDHGKWVNDPDYELKPIKNWAYRPELELNLTNSNMIYIIYEVLGLTNEDYISRNEDGDIYSFIIPVDIFLTVTQVWLQKRLGETTGAVPGHEYPRHVKVVHDGNVATIHRGPRVFEGGRREGYDEQTVYRMVVIANEGKKNGATHIGASG